MGTDNKQELLACPFCKGGAGICHEDNTYSNGEKFTKIYVACQKCVARGQRWIHDSSQPYSIEWLEVEAIKSWNTRAKPLPDVEYINQMFESAKSLLKHKGLSEWDLDMIRRDVLKNIGSPMLKTAEIQGVQMQKVAPAPLPDNKEVGELVEQPEIIAEVAKEIARYIWNDGDGNVQNFDAYKCAETALQKYKTLSTPQPPATGDDVVELAQEMVRYEGRDWLALGNPSQGVWKDRAANVLRFIKQLK